MFCERAQQSTLGEKIRRKDQENNQIVQNAFDFMYHVFQVGCKQKTNIKILCLQPKKNLHFPIVLSPLTNHHQTNRSGVSDPSDTIYLCGVLDHIAFYRHTYSMF